MQEAPGWSLVLPNRKLITTMCIKNKESWYLKMSLMVTFGFWKYGWLHSSPHTFNKIMFSTFNIHPFYKEKCINNKYMFLNWLWVFLVLWWPVCENFSFSFIIALHSLHECRRLPGIALLSWILFICQPKSTI